MNDGDAILSALPPPHGEEPASLRRDLADELSDHLACATRQGELAGLEPAEAVRQARRRFGSPASIARKLYFFHMRERIMAYRLTIGAAVLVSLAAVAGMTMVVLQQQRALREITESMKSLAAARVDASSARTTADSFEWGEIKLGVKGLPEQPVDKPRNFTLVGKALGGDEMTLTEPIGADGVARFGPVHVGKYKVDFQHDSPYPWEQRIRLVAPPVTLLPQRAVEAKWQFPPLAPAMPVRIAVDWPEDLADAGLVLAMTLDSTFIAPWEQWMVNGKVHVLVGPKGVRIVERLEDESKRQQAGGGFGYTTAAIREFAHPREPLTDWQETLELPPQRRFGIDSHQSGVLPPDTDAGDQVRGLAPIFEEVRKVIGETGTPGAGEQTWTVTLPESSLQKVRDALRLREGRTLIDVPWPEALADQPVGIVGTLQAVTDLDPRGKDVVGGVVTAEFRLLLTPRGAVQLDDSQEDAATAFEKALADDLGELTLLIDPATTSLEFYVKQVLALGPDGVVTNNGPRAGYVTSANLGRFAYNIPSAIAESINRILEQARARGEQ